MASDELLALKKEIIDKQNQVENALSKVVTDDIKEDGLKNAMVHLGLV